MCERICVYVHVIHEYVQVCACTCVYMSLSVFIHVVEQRFSSSGTPLWFLFLILFFFKTGFSLVWSKYVRLIGQ